MGDIDFIKSALKQLDVFDFEWETKQAVKNVCNHLLNMWETEHAEAKRNIEENNAPKAIADKVLGIAAMSEYFCLFCVKELLLNYSDILGIDVPEELKKQKKE